MGDRFGNIMSTQMQILELPHGVHETSDYVALAIKAAVFYRIVEPEKTLVRIRNIRKQLEETAVATLAGIIRASSLSDLGSRSQGGNHKFYGAKQGADEKKEMDEDYEDGMMGGYAPQEEEDGGRQRPFFQHVLDEWGIEIQNIRIESLKINDPQLQKSISNNAIDVSKQHNRYIMLQKQQEIVMVEANAAASKMQIDTDARNSTIKAMAKAKADAVVIKAKAEKEALELKGQGESEFARLLESTTLGKELSLMKVQAESMQGLKQVTYVPQMDGIRGNQFMVLPGNNANRGAQL